MGAVTLGVVTGTVIGAAPAASAATVPAAVAARDAAGGPVPFRGYVSGVSAAQASKQARHEGSRQAALHQVVLPDVLAVARRGITAAQLAKLAKLRYVRSLVAVAGGSVGIKGRQVQIIGVNPTEFRSWTGPQTAAQQSVWAALNKGGFVTTAAVAKRLGLRHGTSYRVTAARQPSVGYGGTADIGIPGVDAVVGSATSRQLGLVPQIGVLISAPGASLATLDAQVSRVLGQHTRFVSLRQQVASSPRLPVDSHVSSSRPGSYLALFQESAAMYCSGLSWTVLAAIGQIESADGQNVGPSTAGALGPMQFLPSTWARWGIDGFGETGPPNVMNPYDAVPSAAEYLCAAGATSGPAGLSAAIFAYNHAQWYVNEVLALAQEYAREYG